MFCWFGNSIIGLNPVLGPFLDGKVLSSISKMISNLVLFLTLAFAIAPTESSENVTDSTGIGRLLEPPSRGSMWR